MAVVFCDCRPDLVPALMRFWMRVYRPDYILCREPALFRWQFLGPHGRSDAFNIKLAVVDGEVAGSLGYIPVEVSLRRQVVAGAWLANWMVDPARRQLGLGPLLMRAVTKAFAVTLNNGANPDARSVLTRMGWTDVGALPRFVCVLDRDRAARLTQSGRLDWPAPRAVRRPAHGVVIRQLAHFPPETTDLWDRLSPEIGDGTRRSERYLNWRYAAHPTWRYRCFESRRDGRLTGVAVYRLEEVAGRDARLGRIVELFAEDQDLAALLDAVSTDARTQDAAVLDFFCSSLRAARPLHDAGFETGEDSHAAQIPVLFQPLDYRRTGIHFMSHAGPSPSGDSAPRWYVTKSDADQDRPN